MTYTIETDIGAVVVALTRGAPTHADELRLVARCRLASDTDTEPEISYRSVMLSGIRTRQVGIEDVFWRQWWAMEAPNTATNVTAPASLTVGATLTVDGATWTGGSGDPTITAVLGHWYADLASGNVWKGCRGELVKFAEHAAKEFAAKRDVMLAIDALGMPDEPS